MTMGAKDGRRRFPVRRLVVAGTVAIVLTVALGWVWFSWLPSYRPSLRQGERYGIDVSSHQGRIEWDRVGKDDISFAYIKATEGGDFVDSRFSENWTDAMAAGLNRGAYHFFTLCAGGEQQARNFLRVVPASADAMPPAVDLELAGNCRARPDRAAVARELGAFLTMVERAVGHDAVLYVGDDFEARYRIRGSIERPLWIRRFLLRPSVSGWDIWQVSSFARVDGVSGRVDLDVSR